jgi:hypothetical protein
MFAALLLVGSVIQLTDLGIATKSVFWGVSIIVSGISIGFFGARRFDMFSPVFFVGVSFAFLYGLAAIVPFVSKKRGEFTTNIDQLLPYYPNAAMVCFLCLIGFYLGYNNRWVIQKGNRTTLFCWKGADSRLKLLWAILTSMGIGSFLLMIRQSAYLQVTTELESPLFYSAVGFIQSGLYVAVPLAIAMAFITRRTFWRSAAWIGFLSTLFFGIPSGSKTLVLLAFMLAAIAWNYAKKQFSKRQALGAVIVTLASMLILMPFNAVYRTSLLETDTQRQSLGTAFSSLQSSWEILSEKEVVDILDLSFDYMSGRLSNISVVATILRYQDQGGALHYGGTYAQIFYSLIPRFFWLDKPALTLGQEFAVELGYGLPEISRLGKSVSTTSVGATLVGEQVYNFSWLLAPFSMIIFGMLYRWIYNAFQRSVEVAPAIGIGIYGFLWYSIFFTANESFFAAVLAGGVKFLVFLLLFLTVLKFKKLR